jgi:hypothetical protein
MKWDYDGWLKHVKMKPTWLFTECKSVSRYMVLPIDVDETGNIIQAKSKKCYSSREAVEAVKKIKVLYTITLIESVPPMESKGKPNFKKRHRGYLVRGVW